MHKPIKRYGLDGIIGDDKDLIRLRGEYERLIVQEMRDDGFVPHLDLSPVFTISYNGKAYDFQLSVYGMHVGKQKAREIEGISFGRPIYRTTDSSSTQGTQDIH